MMQILSIEVTPFAQNCRIVYDDKTLNAAVIDPGGEVSKIERELQAHSLTAKEIWLTHSHLDHCGGVNALKKKTKAVLKGHKVEAEMRAAVLTICNLYGLPPGDMDACPEPDEYIDGGDVLEFEGEQFEVLFTPGHSPGHVCFYHKGSSSLIAGDTVFAGSIGRTDLPGGDHNQLIESIKSKILTLPDDTKILPGHGPNTSVGQEKIANPFF